MVGAECRQRWDEVYLRLSAALPLRDTLPVVAHESRLFAIAQSLRTQAVSNFSGDPKCPNHRRTVLPGTPAFLIGPRLIHLMQQTNRCFAVIARYFGELVQNLTLIPL